MHIVDSHCHLDRLDLTAYNGSLDKALDAAKQMGVSYFLCVCIDMDNYEKVRDIAYRYDNVSASVGLHPTEIVAHEPSIADLLQRGQDKKIVAIGETGLDFYRIEGDTTWQQERFRCHIRAARELHKPLIIHTRQARQETIGILKEENASEVGGVLHCFTEDWDMAQAAMDLGFYISFSGIVTFKNAVDLQDIAKRLPLERMLIETDAPYLAPVPYRGKPNQPAYVRYVAEFIAELRQEPLEKIVAATAKNFGQLFNINLGDAHA